jgi:hypothetical protein
LLILPKTIGSLANDFRSNNWGDKIDDVIAKEGENHEAKTDSLLHYKGIKLGSISCNIFYGFEYSRLYMGCMELLLEFKDLNEYITAYHYTKQILAEGLGECQSREIWNNDRYQFNNAMHGYAVKNGDYRIETQWLFPANNIFLELDNQEDPISIRVGAMAPKH